MTETDESNDPPSSRPVNLILNLDAILVPTQNAAVLSSELVDFMFEAMGRADLSKKPTNAATQYKFKTPEITAAERRAMFENWLFSKGFQDLMRGVRASLEQAYLFLELLTRPHKTKSDTTLTVYLAPFKKKARSLNFPDLLDQVNQKLPEPLNFGEAYHSLQRARNCLEHRSGIVGDVDAPGGGVMLVSFPRVKNFYMRNGQEIELEPGHVADAEDGNKHVQILMRIELRERRFPKGQRLSISITDFNEIAFACNYFVGDMAAKVAAAGADRAAFA